MNSRKLFSQLWPLALVFLIAGLGSCTVVNANIPTNSPTNTSTPPDYNRWLRKQPCAAPCWEGITPGVTTYKDALHILAQNKFFWKVESHLPDGITWKWRGTKYPGVAIFDASLTTPVLDSITADSPDHIKLKDVTAVFGYPDYVEVFAEPGTDIGSGMDYMMDFYYLQSGLDLRIMQGGNIPPPQISPETLVNEVIFFASSLDGLYRMKGWHDPNASDLFRQELLPWQGTLDFDKYCKLYYGAKADFHCQLQP